MAILRRRYSKRPRWTQRPRPCPGTVPGPRAGRRADIHTHPREQLFGHRDRHQGAAGGRRPLRPPDAPLEPQDAPLHLRRARRDPHHRPAEDRAPAPQGAGVRRRPRRPRRHDPVRGHEEAGPRLDQGGRRRAAACPTSTSAGWAACSPTSRPSTSASERLHELRDWTEYGTMDLLPVARAHRRDQRARQARDEPRRRGRHAAPARRGVRGRPQDRGDRRARGRAPQDPDHRAGRHQLRPGPGATS